MDKRQLRAAALCMIAFGSSEAFAGDLVINELTQSNLSSYIAAKDFPDTWIEFHNPTDQPIELSQYSLGLDDADPSAAFKLPARLVAPGEYVVVSCDKNQTEMAIGDKIDSGKGALYLFKGTETVETLTLKKMPVPDVSYGRLADNPEKWDYFNIPTPGAANTTAAGGNVLPMPLFDAPEAGVKTAAFPITIDIPADAPQGTRLCVTTDGSEPTAADAVQAPYKADVESSAVIKAKLICDGNLSPRAKAYTYIFPDHDITLGIISMSTDDEYLFSDELGLLTGDSDDPDANYKHSWRRPVNIEIFIDGKQVINQTGEIELSGNSSRHHPQKPFKVYANKRFGEKRFAYPFWDLKPDVTKCKSFMLRNGGSVFTTDHLADEFFSRLVGRAVDLDYQEYRPMVVYLNGKYYGMMDMRERSNDDYVESNYNGLDEICMVEDWWELKTDHTQQLWDYRDLMNDPSTTYEQLCEVADTDEIINYLICEGFPLNRDWPQVNFVSWTPADKTEWRYLVKDLDGPDTSGDHDFIGYLLSEFELIEGKNAPEYTWSIRPFLTKPEFAGRLIDRFVALGGDVLKPASALALYNKMNDEIAAERQYHLDFYGYGEYNGVAAWNEIMTNLANNRAATIMRHIKERYGYGEISSLTIDNSAGTVCVNGHKLYEPLFDGEVLGGKAVTISQVEGSDTNGWEFTVSYPDGTSHTMEFTGDLSFVPPADTAVKYDVRPANVKVEEVTASASYRVNPDGTISISGCPGHTVSLYSVQGVCLAQGVIDGSGSGSLRIPAKGLYILSVGDLQGGRQSYKIAY